MSENAQPTQDDSSTEDNAAPAIGKGEQEADGGPGSHTDDGTGGATDDTASGGIPEAADS